MPGKVQLDKAAWQWVEQLQNWQQVSDHHVEMAYRLNLPSCPAGQCRRNCKGNPFCLNAMGEKSWFKDLDESQWNDFDPESERREEGKFAGLKNLGATCYVNTFLQLWFHNPQVRRAVYSWRDLSEPSETDTDWKPSSICGQLQLLFGFMQYSKRAYIDPSSLIELLGLDTREQQDAQEFSKLFLSVLEGAITQGSIGSPSNIIQDQFAGTYCYITKCNTCGSKSSREATFYELDINVQGHCTLVSSLQEFLKEEKLEGENQYMCSVCNSKQNAVRSIQLHTLPPVLNLQLLRFVFDVKKGHKKKLNTYLQFSDVLDMSQFLGKPAMTCVYDLTAVLIHRGPSAHSGHYIAHIQDTVTKLWFRFNDEDVTAMKGRKLQLGKEEEVLPGDLVERDGATSPKAPRNSKGQHSSRDAYMLVYTRRQSDGEERAKVTTPQRETTCDLPQSVKAYIDRDNTSFEDWIQEIALTRDAKIFSGKEKQRLLQSMYSDLRCESAGEDFEWLPAEWLTSWLSDPDKAKVIDASTHLCPHHRLHPDNVVKMKIVATKGADKLYEEYGGRTRLRGREAVCVDCVRQRCQEIHFKEQLAEHSRFLTTELKKSDISGQCYWVGKTSLRSWKQYAMEQLTTSQATPITTNNNSTDTTTTTTNNSTDTVTDTSHTEDQDRSIIPHDVTDTKLEQNGNGNSTEQAEDTDSNALPDTFNSDLLCDLHGALHPDESCRRLVSEAVWDCFRSLFPSSPQFLRDDPVCVQCQTSMTQEEEAKRQHRERFAQQRELLQELYLARNRPKLRQLVGDHAYIVHSNFVHTWRKAVKSREGSGTEAPSEIVNGPLLCEHNNLLYPITMTDADMPDEMILVREEEWHQLIRHYPFDTAIEVLIIKQEGEEPAIQTLPEVCEDCVAARLQQEENDLYSFEDATIFVRKVVPALTSPPPDRKPSRYEEDPDFVEVKPVVEPDPPSNKKQKLDDSAVRKSQRHRKQRGEKEVKVSSQLTLKDFKTKLMYLFCIPTFDQNLSVDGRPISNSDATLGQLRLYPGCVVTLQADEPNQDAVADLEGSSARKPEEGFKGTNLMSR